MLLIYFWSKAGNNMQNSGRGYYTIGERGKMKKQIKS